MATANVAQQEVLEAVIIRFVGDSGDGMQLTGDPVFRHLCHVRQ